MHAHPATPHVIEMRMIRKKSFFSKDRRASDLFPRDVLPSTLVYSML